MSQTSPRDAFTQEVQRLRAIYGEQRDSSNLFPPNGRPVIEQDINILDDTVYYTYWFECKNRNHENQDHCHVIRVADIPNTLSGNILHLKDNLPPRVVDGDYEIIGNETYPLDQPPSIPAVIDDDAEDVSQALASLPEIAVDLDKHFVKKPKHVSEIENLLLTQGGSCPGVPKSAHIIQLLGKSPNRELVFKKYYRCYYALARVHPVSVYKKWILQLIDGLRCLHALDVVHRDLRIDNLVFSSDKSDANLLIYDLEGRWGNRLAPEISPYPVLQAGWTKKSDVYDLGYVVKGMLYCNTPRNYLVEWSVPAPLHAIVESCVRVPAQERPSLDELYAMVAQIEV